MTIAAENSMPGGKTLKDACINTVLARIDQYELVSELGGGGFGTVYLAKDSVSGVEYAVKGLPPFVKNNREEMENIRANFALVSRLSHTNIVRAHVLHPAREVSYASEDVRQKLRVLSGDFLMVMEYAPGVTLSQWRRQFPDRKVPMAQALEITRQVASALDYAHEQKILHRDVKPANVMVETKPDGKLVARVLDFGLAAEIRSSMGRVSLEIHDTSGTRPYMAPEQWAGRKQGPATDQYALAALFYELVIGEVPFASVFDCGDPTVMRLAVTTDAPEIPPELPKSVRIALGRALAKKSEERFASGGVFVAALEGRIKVSRRVAETRREEIGRVVPGTPSSGRASMAVKAVAVGIVLAVLGAGGYYGWIKYEKSLQVRLAEEKHEREEREAKLKAELVRIKTEINIKISDGKRKMERINEFRSDSLGFETRIASADSHWKTLESLAKPSSIEEANAAFSMADRADRAIQLDVDWLISNKTVRAEVFLSRQAATNEMASAICAKAVKYDAEGYAYATNELFVANAYLQHGEFSDANAAFTNACCRFRQSIERSVEAEKAEIAAAKAERKRKMVEQFGKEEAERRENVETLRQEIRVATKNGDFGKAFASASKLVVLSQEREDCAQWVDCWVQLNGKNGTAAEKKEYTEQYKKQLEDGSSWGFDIDSLAKMDNKSPHVLYMLGRKIEDGSGIEKNLGVARELYSRAVKGGCVKAEKELARVEENIRIEPFFEIVKSGELARIKTVVSVENPRKDVVRSGGWTLMHTAARTGDAQVLDYFESVGYDFNVPSDSGYVPFFEACENTNSVKALSAVKWFVEKKGVDVNYRNESTNTCSFSALYGIQTVSTEAVFDYLVAKGAKTDVKRKDGYSLLHIYVDRGRELGLVKKAVSLCDVSAVDEDGMQPIHTAVTSDSENPSELIDVLVAAGANVNARVVKGKSSWHESYTPLHHVCACAWYAEKKDSWRIEAVIKTLVKHGADIEAKTKDGYTPLCLAANECNARAIRPLLAAKANLDFRVDGKSPIHFACKHADSSRFCDTLKEILKGGARINDVVKGSKYYDGDFVLHTVVRSTSISWPVGDANLKKAIAMLVQNGANIEARNAKGMTPFLMAAAENEAANVVLFDTLKAVGANVNARVSAGNEHKVGYKAIHLVADQERNPERMIPAFKWLLEHGASINDVVDGGKHDNGKNALQIVIDTSSPGKEMPSLLKSAQFLVEKGIDVNNRDKNGATALDDVLSRFAFEKKDMLVKLEFVRFLTKNGANVNKKDKEGFTPLHSLARRGPEFTKDYIHEERMALVKALVEAKADVNARIPDGTYKGWTPLHFAAEKADYSILEALVDCGANVNAIDDTGETPLFKVLCGHGGPAKDATARKLCVGCLINNGADKSIRNKYGYTAFSKDNTEPFKPITF